jgi:hypothetical protein
LIARCSYAAFEPWRDLARRSLATDERRSYSSSLTAVRLRKGRAVGTYVARLDAGLCSGPCVAAGGIESLQVGGGGVMSEQTEETGIRTVLVRFPGGETQYWLTDRQFTAGTNVSDGGDEWIVTEVVPLPDGSIKIALRDAELPAGSHEYDRNPWNLPEPAIGPAGPARDVLPLGEGQLSTHTSSSEEPEAA